MAAPITPWAVTQIAHPELRDVNPACEDCLALADGAITLAYATGSVGATETNGEHSATVERAIAVHTTGPGGISKVELGGRA